MFKNVNLDYEQFNKSFEYIKNNKQIIDVLLSGGDPLLLNLDKLEWILYNIKKISTVKIIRLGTRLPITNPKKINKKLIRILKKYVQYINIHINHPIELNDASINSIQLLQQANIMIGNQSVLLKNVNDSYSVLKELYLKLYELKIRPYYLYNCDLNIGLSHFRVSLKTGFKLNDQINHDLSGLSKPFFIADLPFLGKTLINSSYVKYLGNDIYEFKNKDGNKFIYNEKLLIKNTGR